MGLIFGNTGNFYGFSQQESSERAGCSTVISLAWSPPLFYRCMDCRASDLEILGGSHDTPLVSVSRSQFSFDTFGPSRSALQMPKCFGDLSRGRLSMSFLGSLPAGFFKFLRFLLGIQPYGCHKCQRRRRSETDTWWYDLLQKHRGRSICHRPKE